MDKTTPDASTVTDAAAAAEIFAQFWAAHRQTLVADHAKVEQLDSLMQAQEPSVAATSQQRYLERVNGSLGASGGDASILFGTRGSLRSGDCWSVSYDGLLSTGVSACVDARSGKVLFVWETPEG